RRPSSAGRLERRGEIVVRSLPRREVRGQRANSGLNRCGYRRTGCRRGGDRDFTRAVAIQVNPESPFVGGWIGRWVVAALACSRRGGRPRDSGGLGAAVGDSE